MDDLASTAEAADQLRTPDAAVLPSLGGALRATRPTVVRTKSVRPADGESIEPPALPRAPAPTLEQVLDAVVAASMPTFRAFVATFDFGPYRNLVDIGGATGALCCLVTSRHPWIACRSVDMPAAKPIAERRIRDLGLSQRVQVDGLDVYRDAFPAASLVTMGPLLHDWNPARKRILIAKARKALAPGGAMVALECLGDDGDDRAAPVPALLGAPGIDAGDAYDLGGPAFARWCLEAGFTRCERLSLTATAGATIAYA